jgi:hypothetical protein
MSLFWIIIISFVNVFLHIVRGVAAIKSTKIIASSWNSVCYTFSAIIVKFIAQADLWVAIAVQSITNFVGCYAALWYCEKFLKKEDEN